MIGIDQGILCRVFLVYHETVFFVAPAVFLCNMFQNIGTTPCSVACCFELVFWE